MARLRSAVQDNDSLRAGRGFDTAQRLSGTVHWLNGVSGLWSDAADWSGGSVPTAKQNVRIWASPRSGNFEVTINGAAAAKSLTLASPYAVVADYGTLTLGGALVAESGFFVLEAGGSIVGGTLSSGASGGIGFGGGTLSGVTYQGTISLGYGATLTLAGGTNLIGADGTGAGSLNVGLNSQVDVYGALSPATINLTGQSAVAKFYGVGTLTDDVVNIGFGGSRRLRYAAKLLFRDGSGKEGTLTLGTGTTLNEAGAGGRISGNELINDGTINVAYAGGLLTFSTDLVNTGSVQVSNGATLALHGELTNTGNISISGSNSVLALLGNETTANLGAVTASGGALSIGGTLANTGDTLALSSDLRLALMTSAVIEGGTVTADSSGGILADTTQYQFGFGLLSDLTYQITGGTLNLSSTNVSFGLAGSTSFAGGPAGDGGGVVVKITGQHDLLSLAGTTSGLAMVNLESATSTLLLGNETTSWLGSTIVHQAGVLALIGTLSNSGATLALGTGTAIGQLALSGGGVIAGGVVTDVGDGVGFAGDFGGAFSDVIYQGAALNVGMDNTYSDLTLAGGTVIEGAGGAGTGVLNISNGALVQVGQSTLESLTINDSNNSDGSQGPALAFGGIDGVVNTLLDHAVVNLGTGTYGRGSIGSDSGTLTLGSDCTINAVAGTDGGQSGGIYCDNGAVLNLGTINAVGAGAVLEIAQPYSYDVREVFRNEGTINVGNGGTFTVATEDVGTAPLIFQNEGSFNLTGEDSAIELNGGTFVSQSPFSLSAGTILEGDFGTFDPAVINNGTIVALGLEDTTGLLIAGAVTGNGVLQADTYGTLILDSSVNASVMNFQADAALRLNDAAQFNATINDFGHADSINLGTLTASSATLTANSLTVTLSTGATLRYAMTGVVNGETVRIDGNGHAITAIVPHDPRSDSGFTAALRADMVDRWFSEPTVGIPDRAGTLRNAEHSGLASGDFVVPVDPGWATIRPHSC